MLFLKFIFYFKDTNSYQTYNRLGISFLCYQEDQLHKSSQVCICVCAHVLVYVQPRNLQHIKCFSPIITEIKVDSILIYVCMYQYVYQ